MSVPTLRSFVLIPYIAYSFDNFSAGVGFNLFVLKLGSTRLIATILEVCKNSKFLQDSMVLLRSVSFRFFMLCSIEPDLRFSRSDTSLTSLGTVFTFPCMRFPLVNGDFIQISRLYSSFGLVPSFLDSIQTTGELNSLLIWF